MSRKGRRRWVSALAGFIALIVGVPAALGFPVTRAIQVVTGLTSHALCSQSLISGLDPDRVYAETVRPQAGIGLISWGIRYTLDRKLQEAQVSFLGGFRSRSLYVEGRGCVLGWQGSAAEPAMPAPDPLTIPDTSPRMRTALNGALSKAKAIVVMHDGELLAEAYSADVRLDSRLPGWSSSKSVINAMLGILVRQQRLSMDQRAPVAEWANDERREITLDQLLRMTAGLDLNENHSGFDPASRMLYVERDMAGFAQRARLKSRPGAIWNYTDCNTLILSRIIRDAVGGRAEEVTAFAQRELFAPLGIRNMLIEFDSTGTPVGATHMFAPARDWARFGSLYLNDGAVNGKRILPEGWVAYSSRPTLGTHYAAGFWTAVGRDSLTGLPADAFFASGHLGQKVLIVPSKKLVIARLAVIHKPADGDMAGLEKLYADVVAAMR